MQVSQSPPLRYNNFRLWIERNGCKLHSMLTIAADSSGSMGLETRGELPASTAVMAVPEKLILTVQKCYESRELNKLYRANDDLFDYEESDDAEFNVLAVFVMYEKGKILKGKREHPEEEFHSFWQPYLDSVDQPETAMDWTPEELVGMPQDFLEEVEHFRKQIERMQQRVVGFLEKRQQFQGLSTKELEDLFSYGYKFVMTRCFGYSTPGTSLIPLADLMNHNCEAAEHQLINIKREQSQQASEEYTKHGDKVDMGKLLEVPELKSPEISYSPISQYISEYTSLSRQEAEKLCRRERRQKVLEINLSQRPVSVNSLSLNYFSSSDEEDNDTESDEEELREQEMEFLRQQEREQMEVFRDNFNRIRILEYHDVEEKLNEIQKQQEFVDALQKQMFEAKLSTEATSNVQQQGVPQHTAKPPTNVNTEDASTQPTGLDIEQTKEEKSLKAEREQSTAEKVREQIHQPSRQNQFVEGAHIHKTTTEQMKELNKFKQFSQLNFTEGSNKEEESDSEESDDEFTWFNEPGTYFLISTGRPVGKGKQLYNCYGRRTNRFLLIWYGFCYRDNLFDSVTFRFHVDFSLEKRVDSLVFGHYYGGKGLIRGFQKQNGIIKSNEVSREFRLKRSRLCEGLLIFLRLFLMNQYRGDDLGKLFATLPSSLQFEIFVLSFMEKLVLELSRRYENEQLQKWSTSANYRENFKAVFFSGQTKIVEANIGMIYEARSILLELMNDQTLTVNDVLEGRKRNPDTIRKLRKYLMSIEDNLSYIRLKQPV